MASKIAVSGNAVSSKTVKTYDDTGSGTAVLSLNVGGTTYGLCFDVDGNVYASGKSVSDTKIFSWDDDGDERWSASIVGGNYGFGIDTDENGNAYVAVESTVCLQAYESDGTADWSKDALSVGRAVFVSPAGRVYVVGTQKSTNSNIFCYDADGTALWNYKLDGLDIAPYDIATADDVSIYVVAPRTSSKSLWKLTRNDGAGTTTVAWTKDHGNTFFCCAVTPSGGVVAAGNVQSSISTRQYAADGTAQWTANHGNSVWDVAVDNAGNVYTTGNRTSSITTRKYESDGTLVYSFDYGATSYAVAVWDPGDIETSPPGLPIPLALALPFVGPSVGPAGIPLGLGLGLPSVTATPLPPDLALLGPYPRQVYRLYLATENVQELPLAEITCRRRLGASTWMTCRVPTADADIRAACLAHIGGELLVYAGVSENGTETLGEFLRAVLTEVDSERDGRSGSITLTGRVQNPSYASAERTLLAVQSRGMDGERHTAVCAVDPLLKPNDEVDDGADTWTVGNLEYRINPTMSQMKVTEDG